MRSNHKFMKKKWNKNFKKSPDQKRRASHRHQHLAQTTAQTDDSASSRSTYSPTQPFHKLTNISAQNQNYFLKKNTHTGTHEIEPDKPAAEREERDYCGGHWRWRRKPWRRIGGGGAPESNSDWDESFFFFWIKICLCVLVKREWEVTNEKERPVQTNVLSGGVCERERVSDRVCKSENITGRNGGRDREGNNQKSR